MYWLLCGKDQHTDPNFFPNQWSMYLQGNESSDVVQLDMWQVQYIVNQSRCAVPPCWQLNTSSRQREHPAPDWQEIHVSQAYLAPVPGLRTPETDGLTISWVGVFPPQSISLENQRRQFTITIDKRRPWQNNPQGFNNGVYCWERQGMANTSWQFSVIIRKYFPKWPKVAKAHRTNRMHFSHPSLSFKIAPGLSIFSVILLNSESLKFFGSPCSSGKSSDPHRGS